MRDIQPASDKASSRNYFSGASRTELNLEVLGRRPQFDIQYSVLTQGNSAAALKVEFPDLDLPNVLIDQVPQEAIEKIVLAVAGLTKGQDLDPLFQDESRLLMVLRLAEDAGATIRSELGSEPTDIWTEVLETKINQVSSEKLRRAFSLTEFAPGVFHLHCQSPGLMRVAMLRFQEHYESPSELFRAKHFSRDDFKDWYRSQDYSKGFSYYEDWAGFNFPDYVVQPFREGKFSAINSAEGAVLDLLSEAKAPFYVIASDGAEKASVRQHELAHALFYLSDSYREGAKEIVGAPESMKRLRNALKKIGYHDEVLEDECQAYLVDGAEALNEQLGIPMGTYREKIRKAQKHFTEHFKLHALS